MEEQKDKETVAEAQEIIEMDNILEALKEEKELLLAKESRLQAEMEQVKLSIKAVDLKIKAAEIEAGVYVSPTDKMQAEIVNTLETVHEVLSMVRAYAGAKIAGAAEPEEAEEESE